MRKVTLTAPSGRQHDLTRYPPSVRLKRYAATTAALVVSLIIWAALGFAIWQHLYR